MEILGVDIGGTGMKAAIVEVETGKLVSERLRIPTPKPASPEAVAEVFKELVTAFNWKGQVGCSFPGVIKKGKCFTSGNLEPAWKGKRVDKLFQKLCPETQVTVSNDADLAGIAEMKFGAGKGKMGKVLMLTVGTGIGSGLFFNGELVPNTELGRVLFTDGRIAERHVAESVRKKEELTLRKWAKRFDKYLHHINMVCSPDLFIIGGGISKKFGKYGSVFSVPVPVVPARFRNNAGIIGAAIHAAERQ